MVARVGTNALHSWLSRENHIEDLVAQRIRDCLPEVQPQMRKTRFGVHIPSHSSIPLNYIASYAAKCEELGFDSVWVSDHILAREKGGYEPLSLLSALISSTSRVKLGTSILLVPLRNPVLL